MAHINDEPVNRDDQEHPQYLFDENRRSLRDSCEGNDKMKGNQRNDNTRRFAAVSEQQIIDDCSGLSSKRLDCPEQNKVDPKTEDDGCR